MSRFNKPNGAMQDFINAPLMDTKNSEEKKLNSDNLLDLLATLNKNSVKKKQLNIKLNDYYRSALSFFLNEEEGKTTPVVLENIVKEYIDKYIEKMQKSEK